MLALDAAATLSSGTKGNMTGNLSYVLCFSAGVPPAGDRNNVRGQGQWRVTGTVAVASDRGNGKWQRRWQETGPGESGRANGK